MAKAKILMQKGYPTSDGELFHTLKEALSHQADLEMTEHIEKNSKLTVRNLIKKDPSVFVEYIKHHGDKPPVKKSSKKKAVKKKARPAAQQQSASSETPDDDGSDPIV